MKCAVHSPGHQCDQEPKWRFNEQVLLCDGCLQNAQAGAYGTAIQTMAANAQPLGAPDPFRVTRPPGKKGILREWVEELPPRMQGGLLTAIRGCDDVEKHDPVKLLVRDLRHLLLYCATEKPSSFIVLTDYLEMPQRSAMFERMHAVIKSHDHYPLHYLMHLIHAVEIVGYKHPSPACRGMWQGFYCDMVRKLHMNPETEQQLDARLTADEATFARNQ